MDMLLFWSEKRVFVSFESLPAEFPFISDQLKDFFIKPTDDNQINIENIQLLMPNLVRYRNCNQQIKYVPPKSNIIDIINENFGYYHLTTDNDKDQQRKPTKSQQLSFKQWCQAQQLNEEHVYSELSKPASKSKLCEFNKDFRLIQQATMPSVLWSLCDTDDAISPISDIIPSPTMEEMKAAQNYDPIHRALPNCQRHEVPDVVVGILKELKYFENGKASVSEKNRFTFSYSDENNVDIKEFRDIYRKDLEKYYGPISKLCKATKQDFVNITNEINICAKEKEEIDLFDKNMTDKLCNTLIKRLLTDIEETKSWKCNECWFINRKMMVGGLWRLYNQLNICGMCGTPRHPRDDDESHNLKRQQTVNTNVDESNTMQLKLPKDLLDEWEKIGIEMKCSLNKANVDEQVYLENCNIKQMNKFVIDWIETVDDEQLNSKKTELTQYLEKQKINGRKFLTINGKQFAKDISKTINTNKKTPKLLKLYRSLADININCYSMKRITIILKHFHRLTDQLAQTNNRYPYLMRQLLSSLNETNRTQILDDYDHILQHDVKIIQQQPYIKQCEKEVECIHYKRAKRFTDIKQTLQEKQELFKCDDWKDFVYISYLDQIHCRLLHKTISKHHIETSKDRDTIQRYSNFDVYSTGVFMEYHALSPLHSNLKQELFNNAVYTITESNFENSLQNVHDTLDTQKMKEEKWRAKETNEMYGIKTGDLISVEHMICIDLYCGNTGLCTRFRESYRSNDFDDNNTHIQSYHINNFYWMGRFIYAAIQFFGEKPRRKQIFYHGQNKQFLFAEFSTILETPTSTTPNHQIAKTKFADDAGIVLKLAPKFKHELNNNKYLDVSSISSYGEEEKERLFAGMSVLAIVDISYNIHGKPQSLEKYMKVFLYFERIITQTIHNRNNYNFGVVPSEQQKRRKFINLQSILLVPILKRQMDRNRKTKDNDRNNIDDVGPEKLYLYALFEHFCDSKHDYINLTCINDEFDSMHPSLQKILFEPNNRYNRLEINNDSIKLIFPKLKGYKNHLGYWIPL